MFYPLQGLFYTHEARLRTFVFCLCVALSGLVYGQSGNLHITVVDAENQRPLGEATVSVTPRTGAPHNTSSDDKGLAHMADLAPGLYDVRVFHPNYLTSRSPSVRIIARKVTALQIELTASRWDLEETLVIGKATSTDSLSSVGTSFIDRESLRSSAGSGSDVLRALDGLPGLFSSGEFASFTVRGNSPRDNLILVDDIPFENVVHFDDNFGEQDDVEGGGRFSVFAPNLIHGAEFQPGGWNAAYGGRTGSLLKLEVAEGNPKTPSYTTRLDITGVEIGYDGPSRFDDNTSILFSARRLDFGRLFETIGEEDIGTPRVTDIILKTSSQLSDRDKLNLLAIYAPEDFVRDVENVLASDEDDPGNFEDVELTDSEIDNSLFALTWSRLIGDNAELVNRLYFRHYDESGANGEAFPDLVPLGTPAGEVPVREEIILSNREETEIGLRTDFSTRNALGRFSTGLRATHVDLSFDLTLDNDWIRFVYDQDDFRPDTEQKFIILTPDSVNNQFDETGISYAAYIDQALEFDHWELRAGLRFERDNLSDESLVSPRLGADWQLSDTLLMSATAGVYYQSPRFNDRASDASNSNLENEKYSQFSLGLKYYPSPNIEMLIEPYYQDLDNLVVKQDGVNQTVANSGEGRSYGVDTGIMRRFNNGWSANINYSFNDARVKDAENLPYYDADFSRPHTFSIGGVWEINERWKLSARWKWASGSPRDEFVVFEDVLGAGQPLRFSKEIVSANTDRFDSFNSLNLRVDYHRSFGKTHLITFFDILNVFGTDNPSSTDFNERTGEDVIEEGESLPFVGFRLEW